MQTWKKLHEKFITNINRCNVCYAQYNFNKKQPILICSMHHTICRQCLGGLGDTKKCPFCRVDVDQSKTVINNYIYELLPNEPELLNAEKINPKKQINAEKINPKQQIKPISNHFQILACLILFIFVLISLSSMSFNFYFSKTLTSFSCPQASANKLETLKNWFCFMGVAQATTFAIFVALIIIMAVLKPDPKYDNFTLGIPTFTILIKFALLAFLHILLFSSIIYPDCNGGVYAYGAFQTVVGLITLILFIFTQFVCFCPRDCK